MKLKPLICKVFGHKFNEVKRIIFAIKNNPVNVARHGYFSMTCPRCKEVIDPSPVK